MDLFLPRTRKSEGKKGKIIDLGRALDCNLMSKWAIYPPVRSSLKRWPSINRSSELPLDELFYQWANLADYRGIWEEWAARAWVWASNALSPPVSPSPPLGTDRGVLFLKTCPIWWAFFKLSSSLSGARWKPYCYRAWTVLSSESLMGDDGLWDQCQAILGCWSAVCQCPAPQDGSAGRDAEAQAWLSLLFYLSDCLHHKIWKIPLHPPKQEG